MIRAMPDSTDTRLLTVPQVAERLAVSVRKTYRLISTGQLKRLRVGVRGTRVVAGDLDDYIAKLRDTTTR
jgi:excisionase family DNA binding protein